MVKNIQFRKFSFGWELDLLPHTSFWCHSRWERLSISIRFSLRWEIDVQPPDNSHYKSKGLALWWPKSSARIFILSEKLHFHPHDISPHTSFWRHREWGHLYIFREFSFRWELDRFSHDFNPHIRMEYHGNEKSNSQPKENSLEMNFSLHDISIFELSWLLSERCKGCIYISQRNENLLERDRCSHQLWYQNDAWGLNSWGRKSKS